MAAAERVVLVDDQLDGGEVLLAGAIEAAAERNKLVAIPAHQSGGSSITRIERLGDVH